MWVITTRTSYKHTQQSEKEGNQGGNAPNIRIVHKKGNKKSKVQKGNQAQKKKANKTSKGKKEQEK